jgi:hypothetical protein
MLLVKTLLQRVQRILLHALDSFYRFAVCLSCEHGTGFDRTAIEQNGASSAIGSVTTDVGSCFLKIVPE